MEEEKHIPGETDAALSVEEAPKEESQETTQEEAPKGDTPEKGEEAPKEEAPKDEKPAEPEQPLPKKRSIYDDLKDERQKRKAAEAELAALKDGEPPADKPAPKEEKAAPADDLEAYAQENNLDAKGLSRLVEIITKRIPQAQLSEEEKADLASVREWRASLARQAEDQEVLSQASAVKTELGISDDAELQNVMKEIVKLAHTERFHDKEVGYIVWANKDALSKLVSPRKPSFESGGQRGEAATEDEVDLSSGRVTPAQIEKAMTDRGRPTNEIRRPQ